jgi:large subunit ribosomal protein L25
MERYKIVAHRREARGKGAAKKMRAQGLLPAVFYGPKVESTAVACNAKDLIRILQHGQNVLIELKIKDGKGAKGETDHVVMVRDFQLDPLRGVPIHADLYEVSMKDTMTVEVPIRLVGTPEGTKMGGILEQIRRGLEVECLPADLPPHIEIDVSHLDIGDSIHVGDITVDKIKILVEPQQTIVTVVPPVVEIEPEPEVVPEEEAEEEVEGAPPEEEKEAGEGEAGKEG